MANLVIYFKIIITFAEKNRLNVQIMKNNLTSTSAFAILFVAFAAFAMTACGTREKSGSDKDIDTTMYALATEDSVEKDAPQHLTDTVDFDGRQFFITVDRMPCDTIPRVVDENGPYLDNVVRLTVKTDGNTIINRRFTKNDFAESGEKLPLSRLTLGGMGFNTINGRGIQFNAQLCAPGSLEGGNNFKVSFNLNGGNMRIAPDDTVEDHSSSDDEVME